MNLKQLKQLEKILLEASDIIMMDTKGSHLIMNALQPLKDEVHKEFVMQVFYAYKEGQLVESIFEPQLNKSNSTSEERAPGVGEGRTAPRNVSGSLQDTCSTPSKLALKSGKETKC